MNKKFPLEVIINGIDRLSKPLAQMSRRIDRFGEKTKQVGENFTKYATLPIALGAGIALKSSAQLEGLQVRFESLAGSVEKATEVTKILTKFAADSPFELLDVGNAAASLLAAGFAVEDLNHQFKILGDVAAGAQVQLSEMTPLYTEIRLKGKAFTQDLRQFATRGIPIVAVLAKHLGKSEEAIFDLASKGKITFPIIEKAFESMTSKGGVFYDQASRQGKTLTGIWSTMTDSLNIASAAIGDTIVEVLDLKGNMEAFTASANKFAAWFKSLPGPVKTIAVWTALIIAGIGPLLLIIGNMAIGVAGLIFAFSFMAGVIGGVTVAGLALAGAIGIVSAGVGILFYQFAKLKDMAGSWGEAFKAAILGLGVLIGDALIAPFQQLINLIIKAIELLGGEAPGWLKTAGNFSFGEIASSLLTPETAPVDGGQQIPTVAMPSAALPSGIKNSETTVNVKFDNLPQGAQVSVSNQKGKVKTNVTQGYAMGAI